MALIPSIQPGDWDQVDRNFKKIVKFHIGPDAVPQYTGLTLTGLTANSLIYPDSNKLLTSLGVASDGQLPIGSTGATPVLATLTGTAKRVIVTNAAGSITLSGPQDLDTVDSPTFAGLIISTVDSLPGTVIDGKIIRLSTDSNLYLGKSP
jgi:hypothetical protein